jgi:hypothetical protein
LGNLFSKYFLEKGILETEDYKKINNEDLDKKYKEIKKLFDSFPKKIKKDETFTEDNLIKPILDILGFYYTRQVSIEKKGRSDVPDYLLFVDKNDKEIFDKSEQSERPYNRVSLILEAKRWKRELDKGDKEDPVDPSIPSNQILRYLSTIEISSNGKVLWGILTNGKIWRLYYHKFPSRSEGFVEFDLEEIFDEEAQLFNKNFEKFKIFYLLFRKDAFIKTLYRPDKTFLEIALEEGKKWEEKISSDLKDKIFTDVFPQLAKGFLKNFDDKINENILNEIYNNVLILLYRLLFLFYAEDRSLLPVYDKNYYEYSISKIRDEIKEKIDNKEVLSEVATTHYDRLKNLFKIINLGDKSLKIPSYNGKLFDNNIHEFLEKYSIPDKYLIPSIDKLSRNYEEENKPRINYRELSVRQLGTIYEGLLEFKLKIAEENLKIKKEKGRVIYEIAKENEKFDIKKGDIYITNDRSERKATGSYYTPDYIVQYIVKHTLEPLINDKVNEFENHIERIEKLSKEEINKELFNLNLRNEKINFLRNELLKKYDIIDSILNIKIVDPAMGSGHFLVGAVDFLSDKILELIDKYNNKEIFGKEKYIIPIVGKIEEIRKRILEKSNKEGYLIQENYLNDKDIIKRIVLKRSIYGVDLNPLAVELAKVSLWLHTFMIGAPLSFLDHHLKCGNSLIGANLEDFYQKVLKKELWLFGSPFTGFIRAIDELKKLEIIDDLDISEIEVSNKIYEDVIKNLEPYKKILDLYLLDLYINDKDKTPIKLIDGTKGEPLEIIQYKIQLDDEEKLLIDESLKISKEEKFFHWKLEFPEIFYEQGKIKENGGFDIVIGNPPYIRQEGIKDIKNILQYLDYEVYDPRGDIYTYFYERGYQILKNGGKLGFITSNKWMRAKYGEKLRNLFLNKTNLIELIDFGGYKVFETATVDTNITIFEKDKINLENDVFTLKIKDDFTGDLENYFNQNKFSIKQKNFTESVFTIEKEDILDIKKKIENIGIPLKNWNVKIYRGILTGFNEAFIIDTETRNRILSDCKNDEERKRTEEIIKKVLRGRDIFRYGYRWAGLWIILAKFGFYKIANEYPAVVNHLSKYEKELKSRGQCKYTRVGNNKTNEEYTGQHHWLELDNNPKDDYLKEFEKEKIVWQEIVREPSFAYDKEKYYFEATTFLMTGEDLKYLLGLLNSKAVTFFFKQFYAGGGLGLEGYRYKKIFLEQIPIPKPIENDKNKLTEFVDKMIYYTNKKQILELFIEDEIKPGTLEMIEALKELQNHPSWLDNSSLELKKEIARNLITEYNKIISEIDKSIDSLVYKLYNLTDHEINIIETYFNK